MVTLPRSLPPEMKLLFERALKGDDISAVLKECCGVIQRMCNARDILFMLSIDGAQNPVPPEIEFALSAADRVSATFLEGLPVRWREAGLDELITVDLEVNLSCVSYSAFSWPYPGLSLFDEAEGTGFAVPRDYTLLVPCSSELTVANAHEPEFFGYVAVMFDSFPTMTDSLVHLIVTLPGLLSEIIASLIVEHQSSVDDIYRGYVHDTKRQLLLLNEHLTRCGDQGQESDRRTLDHVRRLTARVLQRTQVMMIAGRSWRSVPAISPIAMDLNDLVRETLHEFQPFFDIRRSALTYSLASNLPQMQLDPSVFPVVVENLLDNAIKHSVPEGRIEVSTELVSPGTVRLEIANEGVPVPESERELVFTPNYRTSNGELTPGEGLGLFVVRRLVEAHGGRVSISDGGELRSVFTVDLPVTFNRARGDAGPRQP